MNPGDFIGWVVFFIILRGLYVLLENPNGKLRCKGIARLIFDHYFVTFYPNRVCRICGLTQNKEDRGFLWSEGEYWYDEGYAENKTELVNYYLDKIKKRKELNKLSKQRHKAGIIRTKIKTPSIRKVKPSEDES